MKKEKKLSKKALLQQKLNEIQNNVYEDLAGETELEDPGNVLEGDHWKLSLSMQLDDLVGMNNIVKVSELAAFHGYICLIINPPGGKQLAVLQVNKQEFVDYMKNEFVLSLVAKTNGFHYTSIQVNRLSGDSLVRTINDIGAKKLETWSNDGHIEWCDEDVYKNFLLWCSWKFRAPKKSVNVLENPSLTANIKPGLNEETYQKYFNTAPNGHPNWSNFGDDKFMIPNANATVNGYSVNVKPSGPVRKSNAHHGIRAVHGISSNGAAAAEQSCLLVFDNLQTGINYIRFSDREEYIVTAPTLTAVQPFMLLAMIDNLSTWVYYLVDLESSIHSTEIMKFLNESRHCEESLVKTTRKADGKKWLGHDIDRFRKLGYNIIMFKQILYILYEDLAIALRGFVDRLTSFIRSDAINLVTGTMCSQSGKNLSDLIVKQTIREKIQNKQV